LLVLVAETASRPVGASWNVIGLLSFTVASTLNRPLPESQGFCDLATGCPTSRFSQIK